MRFTSATAMRRMALYDYYRTRREAYQEMAYRELGGKCANCGSTEGLRHRFLDQEHPLASRYKTNPITLYRRLCREPSVRFAVGLICRECRIAHCSVAQPIETFSTPNNDPFNQIQPFEETYES